MGTVVIKGSKWYSLNPRGYVEKEFVVTGSTAYATNGDSIATDNTGIKRLMPSVNDLTKVMLFLFEPRLDGYTIALDKTNKKFLIRDNTGIEVGSTTATGVNAINSTTINCGSTTGFPSSGTASLAGIAFTYTGITTTSFTGCGSHAATTGGEAITRDLSAKTWNCRIRYFDNAPYKG